ncbi:MULTISPECIES: hypothetical protein [Bacillus]|uniref:hypothetical protein n=1 Tax=Bacillus TaxID=1386 RepID=UPI0015DF02B3|nr:MULTISPECIES: hypothetical protein [Bacillus]MCP1160419.1 hypothetical protein [Bacillus infantis]
MSKVYTLAQLVKKYGSEAQKRSFKKNGNLTGKEFALLIKSVLTEWETYKVEGRGSKRIITCYVKLSRKAERIDKRVHNGKGQLVGEFELNSLVINYLIQNDNQVRPMSSTKWLTDLEIIDRRITGALYGDKGIHLEELQEQFGMVNNDYKRDNLDIDMLEEFLKIYLKHIRSSLVSVFNKLAKAKVIIYQKEVWGCTTKNRHRKLSRQEIKSIAEIKRIFLNKHGLKGRDLFKTKMKEVKAFNKEFGEELREQLNLLFYYDAHFCVLQDSDLGVYDYLKRLQEKGELEFTYSLTEQSAFIVTQVYKDLQSKHSLKLAKGREKNITNNSDSNRIKCLKIMKQYAPMWELLLKYFRCTSRPKAFSNEVETRTTAPTVVKIDELVFEFPNGSNMTNPLSIFPGIHF